MLTNCWLLRQANNRSSSSSRNNNVQAKWGMRHTHTHTERGRHTDEIGMHIGKANVVLVCGKAIGACRGDTNELSLPHSLQQPLSSCNTVAVSRCSQTIRPIVERRQQHRRRRRRHLFRVLKGCIKAFIIRFDSIFYSLTLWKCGASLHKVYPTPLSLPVCVWHLIHTAVNKNQCSAPYSQQREQSHYILFA